MADLFFKRLNKQVIKEVADVLDRHSLHLQYEALNSGWPSELATALELQLQPDGTAKVVYPPELQDRILDKEYGNPDTPPHPVIRNYLTKIGVAK
jgi:hypothetical protein